MKYTIRLVILAAMLALTLPALTQAQTGNGSAGECTDETKGKLYTEYYENRKGKTAEHPNGDQNVAYDAAKKYLAACPNADDTDQYAKVLKKFVASYELETRRGDFLTAFDKKNYQEVMKLGKSVLNDDPNYVRAYLLLGNIGYLASIGGNNSLNAESANYARKAIEMLEAGKTADDWRPFLNKDDALAWLNYSLGKTTPNLTDSIPYLLKGARYESVLKKDPRTFIGIEQAYENGPYAKLSEDYKQYTGKAESPEQKLALENINQIVDRMLDGYARAIALAGNDPKHQANKALWTENMTEWYKFRHNKEVTGMTEFVAGILTKPLPDVPTPITTLPSAPASGSAAAGTAPAGTTGGTAPLATQPKQGAATGEPMQPVNKTTTTPKTTPATSQAKPKPRSNHRRK
ncbi:MAG: hypothetical protein ABI596_00885 [Pyrinomonadaceae bacterium]